MCFDFTKTDKFKLILYKIFLKPSKSAFLTKYQNKRVPKFLLLSIFSKKSYSNNIRDFFLGPNLAMTTPLTEIIFITKIFCDGLT
jgi:hypothetical protein